MSLEENLKSMERSREAYWLRRPETSRLKLRWRALTVRHSFHVLPGESVLELGAGSGLWTEHLSEVLRGENPITAVVFNDEFAQSPRKSPNVNFVKVADLNADLPAESFDYVVGTAILCHNLFPQNLAALYRLLKPGGQLLFFEANYWNPQVFIKNHVPPIGRWSGIAACQVGMRRYKLMKAASHQGFTNLEIIPYDIIHARTPPALIPLLQSSAFVLEHTPLVKEICGTLYIWGKKPGDEQVRRPQVSLATHRTLFNSVSVVAPCYNEEMNLRPLVDALIQMYGDYIHEIIIVNDNSTDRTGDVAREIAVEELRVKVVERKPPGGVGRALRDGYAAATGRYILTMDSDFLQIVPELRDLFDVVAAGHDGAIGSRFSHDSVLMNYPFLKILCNRSFHLLVNLFLPCRIRDISNNLKLYRAEILKNLDIEQDHFAANVETGLKPILSGYDVREVPISWINRTIDMGSSSFKIVKIAPNYFVEFLSIVWNTWRGRRSFVQTKSAKIAVLEKPASESPANRSVG
jgi:SAM-dependent methyltransferase